MFYGPEDAVVVDRGADDVGASFDFVGGVAHGYASAGESQHIFVVAAVAEGNYFGGVGVDYLAEFFYASDFALSERNDVGEEGAPSFGLAVREEWHYGGFAGSWEEGDHLEDVGRGEGAEVG